MAYTLLNDGATHTVSGAGGPYQVRAGTTLVVAAGTSIGGENFLAIPYASTVAPRGVDSQGSTLTITGGSITGGSETQNPPWDGTAVTSLGDVLNISGGTQTGGGSDWIAQPAIDIYNPAGGSISGGTQTGGLGSGGQSTGGHAVRVALASTTDSYTISGGTRNGQAGDLQGGSAVYGEIAGALTVHGANTGGAGLDGLGLGGAGVWVIGRHPLAVLTMGAGTHAGGVGFAGMGPNGPSLQYEGAGTCQVPTGTYPDGIALNLYDGGTAVVTGTGLSFSGGTLSGTIGGVSQSIPVTDLSGLGVSAAGSSTSLTFTSP